MSDELTTITFRLPSALRERIREAAKNDDRPEGSWIRYRLAQLLAVDEGDVDDEETEVQP